MQLASIQHTAGNTKRWRVKYKMWLKNTAKLLAFTATSPSPTLLIGTGVQAPAVLGMEGILFVTGGAVNETTTITIQATDTLGNIKNDTIYVTVVAA